MGNVAIAASSNISLNESPSEKEGKSSTYSPPQTRRRPSMKVPPKRKGNPLVSVLLGVFLGPSMKVPPKRKGNDEATAEPVAVTPLNESPSEKEGK